MIDFSAVIAPPGSLANILLDLVSNVLAVAVGALIGAVLGFWYGSKKEVNERTVRISLRIMDRDIELGKNIEAIKLINEGKKEQIKKVIANGQQNEEVKCIERYCFDLMATLNIVDYACLLVMDKKVNKNEIIVEFEEAFKSYYRNYEYLLKDEALSQGLSFKTPRFDHFEQFVKEHKILELEEPKGPGGD